ncbi:MAG: guanylyl cyclase [Rhodoblastus sp.]
MLARSLTSWAAVGTVVALTGFGPEHWFAAAFRAIDSSKTGFAPPAWLDIRIFIVLAGVGIVVADLLFRRLRREAVATAAPIELAAAPNATVAARAPAIAQPAPERPSIVVLPFDNMSQDPEQDYFSDGIAEDIITDLSKISGLFVIARNSAFAYKNTAINVPQVCRDLGVRYALEGSIRKSGNRVRVTAQLIDGATGGHVWAERYDRDLTDIFDVQDDVTRQIVCALKVTLSEAEETGIAGSGTKNVAAHDAFLKGRDLMTAKKDRAHFDKWMACYRRAVELDADYSDAYAGLSVGYTIDHQNRWSAHPEQSLGEAERLADIALAKDRDNPFACFAAALAAQGRKDFGRWQAEIERALALNPNFAPAVVALGTLHVYTGAPMKGVPYIERAMRLDPTVRGQYLHFLGTAYLVAGEDARAAALFSERVLVNPDTDLSRGLLVAALGHLGRIDEARRVWRDLMEINPRYALEDHVARLPFKDPADAARIIAGARLAGVVAPASERPAALLARPT